MDFTFTAEQVQLRKKARGFAEREIGPLAEELDAAYDYPSEGMDRIKKSGLYGYVVPEAYGGKKDLAEAWAAGVLRLTRSATVAP